MLKTNFSGSLDIAEKAIVAVAGFIAIILTNRREARSDNSQDFMTAVGFMVICVLFLLFVGLLKVLLFEAWRGDFDARDFFSDFDTVIRTFWEARNEPAAWLRYLLFVGVAIADLSFAYGAFRYLVALMPGLKRHARWFE